MQKYQDSVVSPQGRPVAGATVTVTTLAGAAATIYSDNGFTPITAALVTDSTGSFAFYAPDGRYTITISGSGFPTKTIADVLLEDPVDGSAALAASSGSALVGFIQAGSGATTRTVQAKVREVVSPEDFGAVGNGVADDTAAVQAALNTGKRVRGSAGASYLIGPLTQSTVSQVIDMTGCTLTLKAGSGAPMLSMSGARAKVLGGTWDGNKAAGQTTSNSYYDHAAVLLNASGCEAIGVRSINSAGIGIKGGTADNLRVAQCEVSGYTVQGIFVQGSGRDCFGNVIEDNRVTMTASTGVGIYLIGDPSPTTYKQRRWRVSGNFVEGPTSGATTADVCMTVRGVDGVCTGNVTNGGDMGISCDITDRSVISNNRVSNAGGPTSYGIEVNGQRNTIIGNFITGCTYGVIGSGTQQAIDGNMVSGNVIEGWTNAAVSFQPGTGNTARNLSITGNTFIATASQACVGVRLVKDCKYAVIQGNNFVGPGSSVSNSRGVFADSVNSNITVIGNRFTGWERPFGCYNIAAVAQTSMVFNNNECVVDMTADTGWIWMEGLATYGSVCVQLGNVGASGFATNWSDRQNNIFTRYQNSATPEGLTTAGVGSTIIRTPGGAGTTFYVKESGTGNTGWVGK